MNGYRGLQPSVLAFSGATRQVVELVAPAGSRPPPLLPPPPPPPPAAAPPRPATTAAAREEVVVGVLGEVLIQVSAAEEHRTVLRPAAVAVACTAAAAAAAAAVAAAAASAASAAAAPHHHRRVDIDDQAPPCARRCGGAHARVGRTTRACRACSAPARHLLCWRHLSAPSRCILPCLGSVHPPPRLRPSLRHGLLRVSQPSRRCTALNPRRSSRTRCAVYSGAVCFRAVCSGAVCSGSRRAASDHMHEPLKHDILRAVPMVHVDVDDGDALAVDGDRVRRAHRRRIDQAKPVPPRNGVVAVHACVMACAHSAGAYPSRAQRTQAPERAQDHAPRTTRMPQRSSSTAQQHRSAPQSASALRATRLGARRRERSQCRPGP